MYEYALELIPGTNLLGGQEARTVHDFTVNSICYAIPQQFIQ